MDYHVEGFDYSNRQRNEELLKKENSIPEPYSARTIAVGIQYKDGVIIGVDTRAIRKTNEPHGTHMLSNKINKVFELHENVFCGGTGIMTDLQRSTRLIKGKLGLHYMHTHRRIRVATAKELLKTLQQNMQIHLGSFIIGGVDSMGIHLYTIHFDGTSEKAFFNATGTGLLGAMSILEDRWKCNLNENQARQLMLDAITAGTQRVSLTAFNADFSIIRKDFSVEHFTETLYNNANQVQNVETPMNLPCVNWKQHFVFDESIVQILDPPILGPHSMLDPELECELSYYISGLILRASAATTRLQRQRSIVAEDENVESPPKRRERRMSS